MLLFSISPIASPVSLTPKWQTGCVVDRKFNTATGWILNNYSDVPNSLPTHLLLFSCSPLFFFQLNQLDAMNQPKRQQHVTSQAEWHQSYLAWWTLVNAVRFIHFICYYLIVFSCLASQPTYPMVFDWFTSTKDRKASLHPGLCEYTSYLRLHSLIHYWSVFRDVNHDDTECQPSNKTTSGIRRSGVHYSFFLLSWYVPLPY